ncbi:probable thioesterase [[Candida] jaroonii]|uniref:Probable thioesterase n=1 Tax=[Candida] jaroonii TaxID=467808 RepID=A0ACA9YCK3_9ASCO|nr:probable thioesterase [[Candida] jaroonii]
MFGKAWKILLAIYAISSIKTLPLAYVARFYLSVFRNLILPKSKYHKGNNKNSYGITTEKKGDLAIFTPVSYSSYVSPLEYDMFLHKSNSTYFADLDMSRTKLLCQVLQKGFYSYMDNEYNDFKKKSISNIPFIPVARVECTFKKELKLFESYEVVSRIGAWDDKWLYVISKFVKSHGKGKRVVCIAITRYVFKTGRMTIPPKTMVERSGLLTKEAEAQNEEYLKLFTHYASTEQFEELVDTF